MDSFVMVLLQNAVTMSMITLLYIIITPWLAKRYTAQWRYYTWLVIVIGWLIPFRPQFTVDWFNLHPSVQSWLKPMVHTVTGDYSGIPIAQEETSGVGMQVLEYAIGGGFIVWLAGALGFLAYHAVRHFRFMKMVRRWSERVVDEPTLALVHNLQQELGITRPVQVRACAALSSPMVSGLLASVITLPAGISSGELKDILHHELVHLKRRDLWYKLLVLLATAMHWFNPVVHMMGQAVAEQCEIACDEKVLAGSGLEARRQYGETLIGVAGGNKAPKRHSALAIRFYSRSSTIHKRIYALMDTRKKRRGLAIVAVVISCVMMTGGSLVLEPGVSAAADPISADDTKRPVKHPANESITLHTSSNTEHKTGKTQLTDNSGEARNKYIPPKRPAGEVVWYTYQEVKAKQDSMNKKIADLVKSGQKNGYKYKQLTNLSNYYELILGKIKKGRGPTKPYWYLGSYWEL